MPSDRKAYTASDELEQEIPMEPEVAPPKPVDPALLVAREMLSRALEQLDIGGVFLGEPGSLAVVRCPAPEWTGLTEAAWGDLVFGGTAPFDGHRSWWNETGRWVSFSRPDEKARSSRTEHDSGEDVVAKAMWRSMPLAGFSPEPEKLLPQDLVRGADHRVEMTRPTPEDVREATLAMTGQAPTSTLEPEEAAGLTPRILRLARRPKQQADDYVAKLRDILARDAAASTPPPPAVPRDVPTLDRLHGMDEAVAWGTSLATSLREYAAGRLAWRDVERGCLLSGPPGCGKTLFARSLAATCGAALVTGSYGTWLGTGRGHQGDLLREMRKTFETARKAAPAILFLDEVDSFPNRATLRHDHADWEIQVVNALLAEIDGVEGRDGVVLLAACNHPGMLDPALIRSGRLDRHIRVGLPDRAAIARILREHLGEDLREDDLAGPALAACGATGADCASFVRRARRRAREAGRDLMTADLMAAIQGEEGRPAGEVMLASVHEAGHALAECELHPGALRAVTITDNGASGGRTVSDRDSAFLSAADIHRRLVSLLAGRAAEELVLGRPSSGSGGQADSDLAQATLLAASSVASLGLDEETGLVWSGMPTAATLPSMLTSQPALAVRVCAMLDTAYRDAQDLVRRRRSALQALAATLVERRAMDGDEVAALVARHPASPGMELGAAAEDAA